MAGERMRRVDEAMREVLSDAMAHDLKDPRIGFVTVTEVRTSADLRHAKVFVSVLGDEERRAATLAAALTGGSASLLDHAVDRVERFLLERFPESVRVERTLASFDEIGG